MHRAGYNEEATITGLAVHEVVTYKLNVNGLGKLLTLYTVRWTNSCSYLQLRHPNAQ